MTGKKYQIKTLTWLIRDEASVKFHIASDDYFGTIATILNLIRQEIKKGRSVNQAALDKTWKNLENDLMFLQKNYQIKPKTKNKKISPKGKLNSQ
jgi:hypothetical protein